MQDRNNMCPILIADSGSTKTDWALIRSVDEVERYSTSGINPLYQSADSIADMLLESGIPFDKISGARVYFYGAGCIGGKANETIEAALRRVMHEIEELTVESDLLAACHSLCGHEAGIACILGTGANSCYYDGERVVENTHPLGYILGDEGSGAYIGKRLLSDALKGLLPSDLSGKMMEWCGLSYSEIISKVYREEYPNRFLATFTRFAMDNIQRDEIHNIILESFITFIDRNLMQYGVEALSKPICFTGSVAFHFEYILAEAIEACGLRFGHVEQAPMDGLIEYYSI